MPLGTILLDCAYPGEGPACHDLAWYISLGLCLLGCVVQTGWDEALGDDDALEWWADRAREGGVAVMTRRPSLAWKRS